ncbi:MAG: PKD domain-containing protein [Bryobacteraceae bacterium]
MDADLSGGPFIANPQIKDPVEDHLRFAGAHAQNYHIFTPPIHNQWCMVWGANPWIAEFPWAHSAYDYSFKHAESGKLVLEFWITPFDYAPNDGPARAVTSKLVENQLIGLSWAVLDFDRGAKKAAGNCTLSSDPVSVKDGSALCAARLMPLEERFLPAIEAKFSFQVIDPARRLVYFKDESIGDVTKWTWHFGDGTTSQERSPVHQYAKPSIRTNVLARWEPQGHVALLSALGSERAVGVLQDCRFPEAVEQALNKTPLRVVERRVLAAIPEPLLVRQSRLPRATSMAQPRQRNHAIHRVTFSVPFCARSRML